WANTAHQWLEGLRRVPRSRVLTVMFSFLAISAIGEGVMGSLFAPFVATVLGGDARAYGWIVSSQAIGGIAGGLLVGWRGTIVSPVRPFGAVGALSTFFGALLGGLLGDGVGIVTMLNIQGLGYGTAGAIVLIALRGLGVTSCEPCLRPMQESRPGHLTSDAKPS